jgi:hypothetical protein
MWIRVMDGNQENDRLLPVERDTANSKSMTTRSSSDTDAIVVDNNAYESIEDDHVIEIEPNVSNQA